MRSFIHAFVRSFVCKDGNAAMLRWEESRGHQYYDSLRRIEQERLAEYEDKEMEELFCMQQQSQGLDGSGSRNSWTSGTSSSDSSSTVNKCDKWNKKRIQQWFRPDSVFIFLFLQQRNKHWSWSIVETWSGISSIQLASDVCGGRLRIQGRIMSIVAIQARIKLYMTLQ